jgi:polysaccharide export outer membrane protein
MISVRLPGAFQDRTHGLSYSLCLVLFAAFMSGSASAYAQAIPQLQNRPQIQQAPPQGQQGTQSMQGYVRDLEMVPVGSDSDYELGVGDRIQVIVVNHEDLSGEFVIDGEGQIFLPLIEKVDAAGLKPGELESLLVDALKPDYLVNPRVIVQVLKYRPYYLIGEVASRGAFPYLADMTYLKAIAIAGGFSYRAKQDHVYVIRSDDPELEELKLEIKEKVQPGDIIRVAERMF